MHVTHYDLFAGIGGFSYALDTIFNQHQITHIFCEWEAFPTAVLKKHWPEAGYYGDIADLVADTERSRRSRCQDQGSTRQHRLCYRAKGDQEPEMVIVTGGFPCQPFSQAGRRQGTSDHRYLWPEMFAVIQNVRPDWVIAENVRGLATWNDGMVLETVCADLEREGYEVQPFIIPACAVGAPHRRDRLWIIARAKGERDRGRSSHQCNLEERKLEPSESEGREIWRESIGRAEFPRFWEHDWREVALATCHDGMDDGLSRWMDGTAISPARHRRARLKACGNAIVPQVAMEIFRAIKSC